MHKRTRSEDERQPLAELDANAVSSQLAEPDVFHSRPIEGSTQAHASADATPARSDDGHDIFSAPRTVASCSTSVASCSSPTAATRHPTSAAAHALPLHESPRRASPRKRPFVSHDADALPPPQPKLPFVHQPTTGKGKGRDLSLYTHRAKHRSHIDILDRQLLGMRAAFAQVSLRSHLSDFVSHNELQVFRTVSAVPHSNFSVPFALAFSHAAKAGSSKQLVVSSSNEGVVTFIDAAHDNQWDAEHRRHTFRTHNNAVFDVTWSLDDRLISTASGDQTAKLHDVENGVCTAVLAGHECTVKSVAWDPYNEHLLTTGSRDGSIIVWDRRIRGRDLPPAQGPTGASGPSGSCIEMVNIIESAHLLPAKRGGKSVKRSNAAKSVTSVAYVPQSEHHLLSSGSADSMIKIWDLRKSHSNSARPKFEENNEEALAELGGARPHGISHMKVSPDGQRIYALSTDHRIHAFDGWNLSYPAPLATYRHPQLISSSFYVRLSVSPDSRFLACGSVNGGLYLWDTTMGTTALSSSRGVDNSNKGERAVRLVGHTKEVSGVDWGHDVVATCSDDLLLRTWNVDRDVARRRRAGEEVELGWRYSGEDEDATVANERRTK